ncbi:MAG: uridine diphosphate-N-acetylglucosamine-binding protein YvcK [Candidatus Polarisedimenticolia bacterium]|nr:uridine diphosphate-N-acetylglucosamine-binding protein YvcK [bacterium]
MDLRDIGARVRIVAVGGGTGLPAVLRGFRSLLFPDGADDPERLTAVVAVTDDGGSSGRLRGEFGMVAPGDLRNCLVSLSHNEPLMARLFQARYRDGESLSGHSVGNLILAALAQEEDGNFLAAVRLASEVLKIQGRVVPSTLVPARLVARFPDGRTVVGETMIAAQRGRIERLSLEPEAPPAAPGVVEAILEADIVVLGPGSLYSSILPNVILPDVAAALRATRAFKLLLVNAMTEMGETTGCSAGDHVRAVLNHAGRGSLDGALLATDPIPEETLARYRAEGAEPLDPRDEDVERQVPFVFREQLLQVSPKVRHDPTRTALAILRAYETWRFSPRRGAGSDFV